MMEATFCSVVSAFPTWFQYFLNYHKDNVYFASQLRIFRFVSLLQRSAQIIAGVLFTEMVTSSLFC